MAERIGFVVDPGARLRAALRGPRLSLGPRIDRLDPPGESSLPGSARDRRSWAALAGGGLVPEPPVTGRRARRRKAQEWQTVHDHLERVQSAHRRPVSRAVRPNLETPEFDRDQIRDDLMEEATEGLGGLALLARARVRRATRPHLDAAAEEREQELRRSAAERQAALERWWSGLLHAEPAIVRERLHLAFEEHRFAAAVTSVEDDRAHLVVPVAKPSALVGDREPTTEPGGARTLPKMTKERRHEVYEAAIGSGLLSTAAEAFAVCPGLDRLTAAVIAPEHVGGPAALMIVEVARDLVLPDRAEHAAISRVSDVEQAEDAGLGRVVIDRGDVSGALRPLETSHPDVRPVLEVLETD